MSSPVNNLWLPVHTEQKLLLAASRAPSERDFGISTESRHISTEVLQNMMPELSDFMPDRIGLKTLHKMRRDPMLRLGLHFIRMPLMNATWKIEGPDEQRCAFIEWALNRVWSSLLANLLLSLEFGFSANIKQWTYERPPENLNLWSESVDPLVPDQVFALPPEYVTPRFTKRGKFNGIYYAPRYHSGQMEIPDEYVLWYIYDAEGSFGNFYGFPRIGYGYAYWRSYWFRWLLYDRHFEMDADPPLVVWGPSGTYTDSSGKVRYWRDDGLAIGESLRSGSTVYMPSEPYIDEQTAKPSQAKQWDMDFKYGGHNNQMFSESFEYLDVQKLRSILVPEQAIIEGAKGTGSRNVAATYGQAFAESQYVLMKEIDQKVNEYYVDKIALYNYGDSAGTYKKVTKNFYKENDELMGAIIQEIAKKDPAELLEAHVNLMGLAKELGLPQYTEEEYAEQKERREEEALKKQQQAMEQMQQEGAIREQQRAQNAPPQTGNQSPQQRGDEK